MGKLTNQVAVVTGASKGIGAGIAKAFAAEGASVVVNYSSSKAGAELVVKEITAKGGKALAVQGDVSKQADITRLFAETKKASKRPFPPRLSAGLPQRSAQGSELSARCYGNRQPGRKRNSRGWPSFGVPYLVLSPTLCLSIPVPPDFFHSLAV